MVDNAEVFQLQTSCSNSNTAANDVGNSTSWDRWDDTGLFAGACRHDIPLYFANIYQSGEKYRSFSCTYSERKKNATI